MDRLQLREHLQAAGVPEDLYMLVGLDAPRSVREGACVLRPNEHSWEVVVWGPARPGPTLVFMTEAEACYYVLHLLTASPAPRPAPA